MSDLSAALSEMARDAKGASSPFRFIIKTPDLSGGQQRTFPDIRHIILDGTLKRLDGQLYGKINAAINGMLLSKYNKDKKTTGSLSLDDAYKQREKQKEPLNIDDLKDLILKHELLSLLDEHELRELEWAILRALASKGELAKRALDDLANVTQSINVPFTITIEAEKNQAVTDIKDILALEDWQKLWGVLTSEGHDCYCVGVTFVTEQRLHKLLEKDLYAEEAERLTARTEEEEKKWAKALEEKIREKARSDEEKEEVLHRMTALCVRNWELVEKEKASLNLLITRTLKDADGLVKKGSKNCLTQSLFASLLLTGSLLAICFTFAPVLVPLAILAGMGSAFLFYWLEKKPYMDALKEVKAQADQLKRGIPAAKPTSKTKTKVLHYIMDFTPAFGAFISIIGLAANPLPLDLFLMNIVGLSATAASVAALGIPIVAVAAVTILLGILQNKMDADVERLQLLSDSLMHIRKMRKEMGAASLSLSQEEQVYLDEKQEERKKLNKSFLERTVIAAHSAILGIACGATIAALILSILKTAAFVAGAVAVTIPAVGLAVIIGTGLVAAIGFTFAFWKNRSNLTNSSIKKMNAVVDENLNACETGSSLNLENISPAAAPKRSSAGAFFTNPTTINTLTGALSLITVILIPIAPVAAVIAGFAVIGLFLCGRYLRKREEARAKLATEMTSTVETWFTERSEKAAKTAHEAQLTPTETSRKEPSPKPREEAVPSAEPKKEDLFKPRVSQPTKRQESDRKQEEETEETFKQNPYKNQGR